MPQMKRQLRANRNFNAFDGVEHQQAQFAVKNVQVQHLFKICAPLKSMRVVI